jgi:hypothetical protein
MLRGTYDVESTPNHTGEGRTLAVNEPGVLDDMAVVLQSGHLKEGEESS